MKLEYLSNEIIAVRKIDTDTFLSIVAVTYKPKDDIKNLFGTKTEQIEVTQNNAMTGFEMDAQIEQECISFVEKISA